LTTWGQTYTISFNQPRRGVVTSSSVLALKKFNNVFARDAAASQFKNFIAETIAATGCNTHVGSLLQY
jgi:hypothetical protein